MLRVGVVGASGYVGGETLRLLLHHPEAEVVQATSRRYAGEFVYRVHPNLRGMTELKFMDVDVDRLAECDVVFMATPHGVSARLTPKLLEVGLKVIDLSADFRLKDESAYSRWYGWRHPAPELLNEAVYGLPELHRREIAKARLVACPGCMATSAILALAPVVGAGLVDLERIVVDAKMGSSGSGATATLASIHAERFGVVRPYAPAGHRHVAEIEQELGALCGKPLKVGMTAHAVNIVRGILSTIHTYPVGELELRKLWEVYREAYGDEPFVRLVRDKRGIYRLPDPKVVFGTNFCDIGFELDRHAGRLVLFSAIDNLMKGAAGQAVQCLNIMLGIDEKTGLEFPGFHPA